jgi:site-specific recombinase XerD
MPRHAGANGPQEAVAHDTCQTPQAKEDAEARPRAPGPRTREVRGSQQPHLTKWPEAYDHAIREFVAWYCSEPRLAFNRTVVLRYRIHLEQRQYAPATINLRLAAVRRVAYEAADAGLLSPELAAGIRRVKGARRLGVRLGNWLWDVVRAAAAHAGIEKLAPHDLRRTCARLCHLAGGELEQIQFLLGHVSVQTTERYLGCKQKLRCAVNDRLGIEPDAAA